MEYNPGIYKCKLFCLKLRTITNIKKGGDSL